MSVNIPECAIVFGSVTPPQGDVVDLTVHLGCTKEVSSFECLLQNWDKKYSPSGTYPINVGVDGHIDVGRGTNVPQIITLRVEKIQCLSSTSTEHYIRVSGRCWGEKLFRKVVTKIYDNKKGEDIVQDLMDSFAGLSTIRTIGLTNDALQGTYTVYVGNAQAWKFHPNQKVYIYDTYHSETNYVDAVGSNLFTVKNALAYTYCVEDSAKVDQHLIDATDTTFTHLEYENSPVWDILKYITQSCDKAGVIGFDFRVAPDGKFEFFPMLSQASPVSLTNNLEVSEYRKDISRVRNRIMVYGLADKSVPLDKDAWTESLTPADGAWSTADPSNTISLDSGSKVLGNYSIKTICGTAEYCSPVLTLNAGAEVNANLYPEFGVYLATDKDYPVRVLLYDTSGRTASYGNNMTEGLKTKANEWTFFKLNVGSDYAVQWSVDAGFDWTQIKKIEFQYFAIAAGGTTLWIDGLYFGGCRFSAIEEEQASQNAYGLRELTETDEELTSDNACDLRAKALLNYLKDPDQYLRITSTVIDYGTTPLLAADTIHVTLPNENVDSDFRIETVKYYVDPKTQTLEVTLELGKVPPQLADYLYGMRTTTVTLEKLARTKLGKHGIPTSLGGGGGLGVHHKMHEAGDQTGAQWPDLTHGGSDLINGWIAPVFIGPLSDAAAVIQFRTKNKASSAIVDHQFNPSDNEHGVLGCETKHWKEMHSLYAFLYGYLRVRVAGDANPKAQLDASMLQFGPGGDEGLDTWFHRAGIGKIEVKNDLVPLTDQSGKLGYGGTSPLRWAEVNAMDVYGNALHCLNGLQGLRIGDIANPIIMLIQDYLYFGSTSALDTWLHRTGAGVFEVKSDLVPTADGVGKLGYGGASPLRWSELHVKDAYADNYHMTGDMIPVSDNAYDLGSALYRWRDIYLAGAIKALAGGVAINLLPDLNATRDLGSSTVKWSNVYLSGVCDVNGWLNVAGFTVITNARVLQNVTAAAGIITSGRFPLARLPDGTSGYFVKAQGAGYDPVYALLAAGDIPSLDASKITSGKFVLARLPNGTIGYVLEAEGSSDPMYVNPNGRYTPAAHNHAAADIISGVLAEARCPNVYAGHITFNDGITASDYKSSYGNSGLTTQITYLKDLAGNTGVLTFQNGLLTGAT